MKRLAVLLFLFMCGVATSGCGPLTPTAAPATVLPRATATSQATPTIEPTATGQPESLVTAAPPTPTPFPVELVFWHAQGQQQRDALDALVRRFDDTHPGIRVTAVEGISYTDLVKQVRSGPAPELALAYPSDLALLAAAGALTPLDGLIQYPEIGFTPQDLEDISPGFVDHYPALGGRVYSLAFMRSMEVMYYNADLLKAAGFEKPPESWDDFAKVCAAVSTSPNAGTGTPAATATGTRTVPASSTAPAAAIGTPGAAATGMPSATPTRVPQVFCYEMAPDASTLATWVLSRGGSLLSSDGRTAAFDQKAGLESLSLLDELFRKKQAVTATRPFQELSDFAAGRVAFVFDSTAGLAYYDKAIKDAGAVKNWGIAPSPHLSGRPVVDLFGPSVAILKTTPEKERAAFVFLAWLMDPEPGAEWARATGYLPARQSAGAALADYIQANERYGSAFALLPYGRGEPAVAAWGTVRAALAEAMSAVASGRATPETALKEAAKKANAALAAP